MMYFFVKTSPELSSLNFKVFILHPKGRKIYFMVETFKKTNFCVGLKKFENPVMRYDVKFFW